MNVKFSADASASLRVRSIIVAIILGLLCIDASHARVVAQDAAANSNPMTSGLTQPAFNGLTGMPGVPQYLATRLGRLHFWTLGDVHNPALILLHQGPWFSIQFSKVMPLLVAQDFRVIAVDIPGFGFSQRPDHSVTGAEYADALVEMLDHLDIKKASVVGTLTGATISLAFASTHSERTQCALLQSMPVYSEAELSQRLEAAPPDTHIFQDGRHISSWWRNIRERRALTNASPEALQWLMIGTMLAGDDLYAGEASKSFVTRTFDSARAIGQVKAPTLIISLGDKNSENWASRALELRPDFRHQALPKLGALIPYDQPEAWVAAISTFLKTNCHTR